MNISDYRKKIYDNKTLQYCFFIFLFLSEDNDSEKAFRNLSGVDVTTSKNLNTELLAPGGDPGRLVVFSKSAVSALGERL